MCHQQMLGRRRMMMTMMRKILHYWEKMEMGTPPETWDFCLDICNEESLADSEYSALSTLKHGYLVSSKAVEQKQTLLPWLIETQTMQNVISNPMNIFTIFVYITFVNCDYKQISCVDKWKCPISTPPHPINQMCRITLTVWKLFHTFAHQIIAGEVILSTSELFFTGCVSNIYLKAQAADACRYRQ